MKMYILVKDTVPLGLAINSVGHTSLATYLKFKDHPDTIAWVTSPHFQKVTCIVTDKEFEKAQEYEDHLVMTEKALEGKQVAIGFRPRAEWPKFFKFLRLYDNPLNNALQELSTKWRASVEDIRAPCDGDWDAAAALEGCADEIEALINKE